MSTLIPSLIVLGTLAFGAVYPWGYLPLFVASACIGLGGLIHHRGAPVQARRVAIGLLLVALAVAAQLVPVRRNILDALSPHAADVLSSYSLAFAGRTGPQPLSINPGATALALLALGTLGLYLVGVSGALSPRTLRRLPRNLMLFAVPLALFGIVSRERSNGLIYWFWQPKDGGGGNGFGPFVNRNHFAGWMLMASCLAIGLLLGQLERARKDVKADWRSRPLWVSSTEASTMVLTAVSIIVMAISLVWTMSRSGITSFIVAVGCFSCLIVLRRRSDNTRRAVALATVGLVLLAGVSWRGTDLLLKWFGDTRDLESRFAAWQDGWRVVSDFPLVGIGLNTYPTAMLFYQKHNLDLFVAQAHNDYLQLLAEGGLLVMIPAAIAVACLVVGIFRSLHAARHESRGYWVRAGAAVGLLAIGVQETVEFSLQIPANAFLFCTLAAIALAPVDAS